MSGSTRDPMLRVKGVTKRFGDLVASDSVSFQILPGEIYGLLGPNGAGKTTTISMISGLTKPDTGSVSIAGEDLWSDPPKVQKHLGAVPQEIALYDELSGVQNLEFWGRLGGVSARDLRSRSREMLETLDLCERGRDPVKTYSGGMKRRINIGCALMHRPELLLLDEPTVGIDPQARERILGLVRSLAAEGMAVLYTTHYLEEAELLCNRIGIIDHGRILAEGTLKDLQSRLGSDQIFVLEGDLKSASSEQLPELTRQFRVLQERPGQWIVSGPADNHPSESLKVLLGLPLALDNVAYKKPNLSDVFLQLTGRELRE
jgi:ABC-2 type transport system ATP-binding protein